MNMSADQPTASPSGDASIPEILPQDFVLLLNTRSDKGFDLILEVAALLPNQAFVCVAGQSEDGEARDQVVARGLSNVTILPRQNDVAPLYEAAKIVAVPSYAFVETFSRVCIEAHRFGKPVLGATSGNIPFLLEQSGIVLPEDARAWADEIIRLTTDTVYYTRRQAAARANSERYSSRRQREDILGVLDAAQSPILVAIGSGVGNMIHVGPMIRRIAEHFGHRVDIIVSQDHRESLFLLQDARYVNAVFALNGIAMNRRYDTIFVTHSFGAARLPFRARQVLWSRDWDMFEPGHALHETVFNLEAARALLGVDYAPDDVTRHYVSDLASIPYLSGLENSGCEGSGTSGPDGVIRGLVGLHGGSKAGFWASKRWPHFPEFAQALKSRGYRVASFGIAEEYVEGTEDRTGGSLRDMALSLRDCDWFVSNDSGVMNLANALGIPLLALFGPTNWRTRGPLGPASRSLSWDATRPACECNSPKAFTAGLCRCIDKIPLDRVLAAFDALVAGGPAPLSTPGTPILAA